MPVSLPPYAASFAALIVLAGMANAQDATTFVEASSLGMELISTEHISVGDLNGDGAPDVVSSPNTGTARYFLHNGTADPFAGVVGVSFDAAGDDVNSTALGDIDDDGDIDVVFRKFTEGIQVALNNGSVLEPFAGVQPLVVSSETDFAREIEVADMDGNGSLDIVIANTNRSVNQLYLNNGTADPFANVSSRDIGTTASYTDELAIADVDNDGDPDVAFVNSNTGFGPTVELYLNNGTADPFAGVSPLELSTLQEFNNVQIADFTGDGLLDLAAGRSGTTAEVLIFVNNGSAIPYTVEDTVKLIHPDDGFTLSLVAHDLNLDGDTDLVMTYAPQPGTPFVLVFLNNGTPDPFAGRVGTVVAPEFVRGIAAEDMDSDGIPDMVIGVFGPDRLFLGSLGPDTVPPRVNLLTPIEDTTIFDTVTLSAFVGDNLDMGTVTFLGNALELAVLTDAPYEYELDTNLLINGIASISAVAVDAAGNSAADTVSVFVANVNDIDEDFIPDELDNCLLVPNTPQRDTDADGIGNACDPDLTNDCLVNFSDLSLFRLVFFSADPDADYNGDGIVNFLDLQVMRTTFFGPPGPSGIPNICEE